MSSFQKNIEGIKAYEQITVEIHSDRNRNTARTGASTSYKSIKNPFTTPTTRSDKCQRPFPVFFITISHTRTDFNPVTIFFAIKAIIVRKHIESLAGAAHYHPSKLDLDSSFHDNKKHNAA